MTDQVIGDWFIRPTLDIFDLINFFRQNALFWEGGQNLAILQNILLIFALSPISPTQSQMAQSVSNS